MDTVIHTTFLFLYAHEANSVYFTGNTPAKTRLYRAVISKSFLEAKNILKFMELPMLEGRFASQIRTTKVMRFT